MKRFHVHLHVEDLAKNIAFYSQMFGSEPTKAEPDYAKWMLDEPAVNFAISTRGRLPGVGHLGIQTDDADELAALKQRAEEADVTLIDEGETQCCYARSEKHWVVDPQGVPWEYFNTLADVPIFGKPGPTESAAASQAACCTPSALETAADKTAGGGCAPTNDPFPTQP